MKAPHPIAGRAIWVMAKGYAPDEGGMQTYARKVAEAYADMGAVVTVFTQSSAGPRRETLGVVQLRDIGPGRGISVPLRLAAEMRRALRVEGAPMLVHATTWRTALLPWALRLPYIVTVHGREMMYARGLALRAMRRALLGARRIVAVSAYTRGRLIERVPQAATRAVVAWNGIGEEVLPPRAATTQVPLIMTLCRLEPRKNIARAICAAAACAARGMDFRYVICGRGPDSERLAALVRELGMGGRIDLRGFVSHDEAKRLYASADIFLHPQLNADGDRDFEGFGIAIADAMAAGMACIAGRSGGTQEIIDHGHDGLLVDGEVEAEIETALAQLLADPALRQRMGAAAREQADRQFRWDRHCAIALDMVPPG